MIDFRYHLVSVIAVFLALTVGLVLGTTMLQDPLLSTLQSETSALRDQSEDLRTERDVADRVNAGADQLAEAVSEDMLEDRLAGLGVAVVASPGADAEMAQALAGRVEQAGGEVVGRVQITEAFLDGGNATFVDELALQIAREPDDLTGGPHEKAAAELGRALSASEEDEGTGPVEGSRARADDKADTGADEGEGSHERDGYDPEAVLEAFTEGGLITVEGEPADASDAVLLLAPAGGGASEGQDPEAANAVLTTIATTLHEELEAAVVAGDGPSARGTGMLAQARAADAAFATVDLAGRPMGEIITALALAEDLEGEAGAYGVGEGVQGFLPDPLPEPRTDEEPSQEEPSADPTGSGSDEARRANGNGG